MEDFRQGEPSIFPNMQEFNLNQTNFKTTILELQNPCSEGSTSPRPTQKSPNSLALEGGESSNYVTMTHNEPSDDAQRVAELQKQIDGMQNQITEMIRTREATGETPTSLQKRNLTNTPNSWSKVPRSSASCSRRIRSSEIKTKPAIRSVVSTPRFIPWGI
ncbi:LOW QUALITY PROTEIN: hypothetical protein HID58_048279 [Brassica napus]|uniref:Uncharacterized protein n=1 Tax=Brassica napus TaxID=3708 RepID=A0ABQ8B1M7_BRANA|nr:LOW QUALITY PROTEIN: hypothetical protein HID58_048279 [Brassica napus]